MRDQGNNNDPKQENPIQRLKAWATAHKFQAFALFVTIACGMGLAYSLSQGAIDPNEVELTTDQFNAALKAGQIKNVTYNAVDQDAYGFWDSDDDGQLESWVMPYSLAGLDNLKEQLADYPSVKFTSMTSSRHALSSNQTTLMAAFFFGLITFLIMRESTRSWKEEDDLPDSTGQGPRMFSLGGNKGSHGEKRAMEASTIPDVTFDDVKGCDEALAEVKEIKEFLDESEKFARLGAKTPHGILLAGSPGTGKTYMAKALANEAGAAFFFISGSDFMEMFVGVGAQRVRQLFASARKAAPSIIFIDEIDAIGKKRAANTQLGDGESDRTLNQLLVEMDGFGATDNVIVMGATNRIDTLDPALLRPGRFDRHIMVDLPDKPGRLEILKIHSKDKPVDAVDFEHYATITAGMSGAELSNLMNEAAIFAARRDGNFITDDDMNRAFERIVAGAEKKGRVLSDDEKKTTAYHEAGHAIVGHLLEGADKVSKISIVSRGQALGYTLTLPEDDKFLQRRRHLKDKLAMFLGGLVAEEMINDDDISTGPSNDLERATQLATSMATRFGMCDELGRRAFVDSNAQSFGKSFSEETEREIDKAVGDLMKEAHDTALSILTEHRDRLDQIAEVLVQYEVVEGAEMEDLLDGCWKGHDAYEKAKTAEELEKDAIKKNPTIVHGLDDTLDIPGNIEAEPEMEHPKGLGRIWERYKDYKQTEPASSQTNRKP